MPKVSAHSYRLDRDTYLTLDQLYEETRLRYVSITAEARRARAPKARRVPKVLLGRKTW
jgi:hypothetical protein